MTVYRFYYLDSADRIAAADVIYCDADAEAQARADGLLAASDHAGIEVWDQHQVVYRARKKDCFGTVSGPLTARGTTSE